MPFPTTSVLDTFSGTLGSWTNAAFGDSALTITSGAATSSVAGWGGAFWTSPFASDQEAYVTVSTLPAATKRIFLNCRCTDTGAATITNYHVMYTFSTSAWSLRKWISGTSTVLASGTQAFSAGDSVGISAIGTTITAYYRSGSGSWTTLGSGNDGSITGSSPIGVEIEDNVGMLDNFGGGAYVPEPAGISSMDKTKFPKIKLRVR